MVFIFKSLSLIYRNYFQMQLSTFLLLTLNVVFSQFNLPDFYDGTVIPSEKVVSAFEKAFGIIGTQLFQVDNSFGADVAIKFLALASESKERMPKLDAGGAEAGDVEQGMNYFLLQLGKYYNQLKETRRVAAPSDLIRNVEKAMFSEFSFETSSALRPSNSGAIVPSVPNRPQRQGSGSNSGSHSTGSAGATGSRPQRPVSPGAVRPQSQSSAATLNQTEVGDLLGVTDEHRFASRVHVGQKNLQKTLKLEPGNILNGYRSLNGVEPFVGVSSKPLKEATAKAKTLLTQKGIYFLQSNSEGDTFNCRAADSKDNIIQFEVQLASKPNQQSLIQIKYQKGLYLEFWSMANKLIFDLV